MSHVYNAIKNRDASQKICEGVYTYIKSYAFTFLIKEEQEYWKEVYRKANANRNSFKKLLEVL
jgi:hypothetical protein